MLTVVKADPHELADRLYPKLARQIKAVLDAVSSTDDLDVLRIPDEIRDAVRDVYAQVAAATAAPASASLGVAFNSVNPAVTAWASTHTGQLITLITDEARDAIREAIVEAARQGLSIDRTARNLRPYLGLNAPQARALARFEASFDTPSPKLVERRAAKLLRERAEMIARTELIQASNMGQQITWTAAADQGLIPRTAFKEWLATSDDRTCPICMNMDGTRVPYNESYTVTTRFDAQGAALATASSVTPPAHPRCRCAMVLVNLDGEMQTTTDSSPALSERDKDALYGELDGLSEDFRWKDSLRELRESLDADPDGDEVLRRIRAVMDEGVEIRPVDYRLPIKDAGGVYQPYGLAPDWGGKPFGMAGVPPPEVDISRIKSPTKTQIDAYEAWSRKATGWEEGRFILVDLQTDWGTKELSQRFVHEVAHAYDDIFLSHASERSVPFSLVQELYRTNPSLDYLWYASTKPAECVAELVRLTTVGHVTTSPEAFARQAPELAEWARSWLRG